MHRRSSVPYRPANIDQLFNINKGHQQPQPTPASQQLSSSRVVATPGLPAPTPTDNDAQQYGSTTGTAATGDEAHASGSSQLGPENLLLSRSQELHSHGSILSPLGSTWAASDSRASSDASALCPDESSARSASLSQAEFSSGSCAESSSRSVNLSDAVREFLAKPVSGPYRPIFFDLETTGMHVSAVRVPASWRRLP